MPTWLIYDGEGEMQSVASWLPEPLEAGHTAVRLSDAQVNQLVGGYVRWDPATLALVPVEDWDPAQVEAAKAATRSTLRNSIPVLRGWAADARNTTITQGNVIQVTNVMLDRLGKFFDAFADLLETRD
jgi:hypothetical protein